MLWLWILGNLAVLIIILCQLRLRVQAEFGDTVSADLFVGFIRIRLVPSADDKQKTEPTEKKPASGNLKEKVKTIPKPSASDIQDAYRTLKPVFCQALRRTRRGIRIDPLDLSVVFSGREDPAQTAELYGYANAAVWTVMPALETLLVIPDPHIRIDMDFDALETRVRGTLGFGMRIGTLLLIAFGTAVPVLRYFRKYLKRKRLETSIAKQAAEVSAA